MGISPAPVLFRPYLEHLILHSNEQHSNKLYQTTTIRTVRNNIYHKINKHLLWDIDTVFFAMSSILYDGFTIHFTGCAVYNENNNALKIKNKNQMYTFFSGTAHPREVNQISTVRQRDNTHKHLTYNRYQSH